MTSAVVAGAGIAGLTAALALAAKGFAVTVFEKAEDLQEAGAGLQLSPNATRVLRSLGVLDHLEKEAVRPQAVILKDAASLAKLARVPLGPSAEERWGAPYLVAHRADLQGALLRTLQRFPSIKLITGAEICRAEFTGSGVMVEIREQGGTRRVEGDLLVAADGVWSKLRELVGGPASHFTGYIAYRAILTHSSHGALSPGAVNAFLSPGFHLVAYPLRGGAATNLVAVTRGAETARGWSNNVDTDHLLKKMEGAAPALLDFIRDSGRWTAWPIYAAAEGGPWVDRQGLVLIGDAAHALTPYAAQGAAMAIEDAAALATLLVTRESLPEALTAFERTRKARVQKVIRRGNFNRLVWHAGGVVAFARNLALKLKSQQSLAADLDWLYAYDAEKEER
ncbi:FAD-dependent monooxygenase [Chelativorans sp. J32]|uniref:FAD-dependent monooxygenase n=1 Tax=Chelativorans sp. J32 TaxID=935840 RepID=UPI00048193C2|nr:FAD-dependent monooxygenase [Chelativorans sp. J32]